MDDDEYALVCSLQAFPSSSSALDNGSTNGTPTPELRLTVNEETFTIIKRQIEHRRFRTALRQHRQEKVLKTYLARHGTSSKTDNGTGGGESIYEIAASVDFSPCMMARLLLEAKYGWSKTTISNFFRLAMNDGDQTTETELSLSKPSSSSEASREINRRGLSEAEYNRLLREVNECTNRDTYCSPLADRIRHNMGVEYEYILLEKLRNRRLVFESEDVLREKGLAKTPDVRLLLPIGVHDAHGVLHIVHWIDSKAMFGDRHTHETENASQLQGYVNRYGPGMVIYWFGHMANLSSADSDVLITHEFPKEITLPGGFDPLEAIPKVVEGQRLSLQFHEDVQTDFDSDWNPVTTCYL